MNIIISERDKWGQHQWGHCKFHVFRQRDFLVPPLNTSSQKCQGTPFSNPAQFVTFAAAPLVLTPFVRNQMVHRGTYAEWPEDPPDEVEEWLTEVALAGRGVSRCALDYLVFSGSGL